MADVTIPAGTVCMTAEEVRFATLTSTVLAAGTLQAEAPAEAVAGGAAGNVGPGEIQILTACPVAVTGCTNPAAFAGGSDAESDEELRERILESYRRLPNGANAAWYEQTALSYGGVAEAGQWAGPAGSGQWTSMWPRSGGCRTPDCWGDCSGCCRKSGRSPWMCRSRPPPCGRWM